ncbi:low temperature requirement protein A [Micromonospora sp. NPDC005413]|uniref:low temperature requirement protein A n=1 Tax=Micromonospora sp. NPDC005413 TaxID=3154563 RepID=UPI0033BB984A
MSWLSGRLLQRRENPRRASFLELFVDLAFIFALTRLSQALLDDPSLNGGFQVLLMLWVMFGGLLMAAAVPTAFAEHAMVFALAYVAIHLGRAALLVPALRGHPLQLRTVRVAVWFAISGAPCSARCRCWWR